MTAQRIVAVDPGREKCGVAVMDGGQGILHREIVAAQRLSMVVSALLAKYECQRVVLGNQTFARSVRESLQPLIDHGQASEIAMIDERGSTGEARARYWQEYPPTGWRHFIPLGLLVPPCAVDDFAAIILAERYFQKNI